MGFNKRYLPELEDLKKEYEHDGHEQFVRRMSKYDALIGPSDSMKFVNHIIDEEIKKNQK